MHQPINTDRWGQTLARRRQTQIARLQVQQAAGLITPGKEAYLRVLLTEWAIIVLS